MDGRDWATDKNGVIRKRKTHCKHGHKFDGTEAWHANWRGFKCRVCRECARARIQRKRENPDFKANEAAKTMRWRKRHPDRYVASYRASYEKRDAWIRSFKTKCRFCPESRYPCLDFHHRDGGDKLGTIGQIRHWPHDRLLAEIEKCDIVCANCHRWHHWQEKKQRKEQDGGRILEND